MKPLSTLLASRPTTEKFAFISLELSFEKIYYLVTLLDTASEVSSLSRAIFGLLANTTKVASRSNYDGHRVDLSVAPSRELRQEANDKATEQGFDQPEPRSATAVSGVLEELRIHQIELEMQNDELRRVQTELEASRALFFDLYDLAPVGYITVDQEGIILQANLRAATLFALARSSLVGRNFIPSIAAEGQEEYYLARNRLLQTGEPQVCELIMSRSDASPFWARLEMSSAQENGAPICRIVIVDITERHYLEDALRDANAQLAKEKKVAEDATRAKSQFLSTMTHEIRTPLNGVVGMAGLLLQTELNTEQLSYARIISESGEALLGLVNNILDFSKIEAGGLELDQVAFDLESLIEDVLDLMSFQAHEKSLELAYWYPAAVPRRFTGDAGHLRQVLMNLLANAIKFTNSGYVLVEVEALEAAAEKQFIRIAVHDTGIGISEQNLSRLFTRFRQADPTITRRFGGTGLGLSIVKQIVECMGGEVNVTSVEREGSTFSCNIPLTPLPANVARAPFGSTSLLGMSVLVSGGQQIARFVVSEWCQGWGMNVQHCDLTHLPHVLKSAAEEALNFQMVIVDGSINALFKAISEVRKYAGVPAPKLVLLSADPLEQAKHLRADAILATPVRSQVLCQKLCELVQEAGAQPLPVETIPVPEPSPAPVLKVLVTDDNLVNQKLACALLAKLGCQVDTADNGEEAVAKVSSSDYAVVFMDCVMPGMDGFQATDVIRNLANHCAKVPIVALTASATAEDRDHCFAVGMNDFLTKPIRSEQLAACLIKWRQG